MFAVGGKTLLPLTAFPPTNKKWVQLACTALLLLPEGGGGTGGQAYSYNSRKGQRQILEGNILNVRFINIT
jgi:hypothetical protein